MININECRYSVDQVMDYIRSSSDNYNVRSNLEVVDVNSTSFNNGTSIDYPYCHNIKHPETGEILTPVRGYMGLNEKRTDRCYYAEYCDSKGNIYSYHYQFAVYDADGRQMLPAKDIATQQHEDDRNLERKSFTDIMNGKGKGEDAINSQGLSDDKTNIIGR